MWLSKSLPLAWFALLSFGSIVHAQDLPHARALFADSVVVPAFPFQAQVDSVAEVWRHSKHPPQPEVMFTLLRNDGTTVDLRSYFESAREQESRPECFLALTVEWTGAVSAGRVITCRRGNIPNEDLLGFARQIQATVVNYGVGGFPVEWSLPALSPGEQ